MNRSIRRQRGAGALIVVLVLFFVMALVAAYSSRNMIFEQRTSANQYRSTQAFEVAAAGSEWALALLNASRIDAACEPSSTVTDTSFRERYLAIDNTTGNVQHRTYVDAGGLTKDRHAMCVRTATGWSCSCPDSAEPAVTPAGSGNPEPAFLIAFRDDVTRPGLIWVRSKGCTQVTATCLNFDRLDAGASDAATVIEMLVNLRGAVATPPSAALTARGRVNVLAAMRAVNTDVATNGVTVNSGDTIDTTQLVPQSTPGTPPANSLVASDTALAGRSDELMFSAFFGMRRETYRQQPATIVLNCPADCGAAAVRDLARLNPGRMLWLNGTMDFDASVDIGSPTAPVVMVVNGDLRSSAGSPRIYGMVYVNGATWTTAGSLLIQGAAVAHGTVEGAGTPAIVYDPAVLRLLRLTAGSFVPVPGGWRDS